MAMQIVFLCGQLLLPLAAVTYLLVGWLLARGKLPGFNDRRALQHSLVSLKQDLKKSRAYGNPFLAKWMRFGGGFYGLTAMYTFFVLEPPVIFSLIQQAVSPVNWSLGGLIALFLDFLISSIQQLVRAAVWFAYWFENVDGEVMIVGVIACYLAYVLAARRARSDWEAGRGHMRLWRWLDGTTLPSPAAED